MVGVLGEAAAEEVPEGGLNAGVLLPVPVEAQYHPPQNVGIPRPDGEPDPGDAAGPLDLADHHLPPGRDGDEVLVPPGPVVA